MPIYLADTNFLRDPRLHRYLRGSKTNKLAISDHVMMEAMKKDPEITVRKTFWIASQYPCQIVGLKGQRFSYSRPIAGGRDIRNLFIKNDRDDFSEWYRHMSEAEINPDVRQYQRDWQADAIKVHDQVAQQVHGLEIVFRTIKETLTSDEISEIKSGQLTNESTQHKLVKHISGISQSLFERAGVTNVMRIRTLRQASNFFLFRYSICIVVLFFKFVENGNIAQATEKLVNHIVDMELAAEASYFNGILTNDRSVRRMHRLTRRMVSLLGGYVMTQGRVSLALAEEADSIQAPARPLDSPSRLCLD